MATIEDEAFLGYEVLYGDKLGPADTLVSQNRVRLGGVRKPVFQEKMDRTTKRVTVADDVCISGMTEAVLTVFVERFDDDDNEKADFVIEPTEGFTDRYPFKMASTR